MLDVLLPICTVLVCFAVAHFPRAYKLYRQGNIRSLFDADTKRIISGALMLLVFSVMSVPLLGPIGPGQAAEPRLIPFQTIISMTDDCIKNGIIDNAFLQGWDGSIWNGIYVFSHSARNLAANVVLFVPIGVLTAVHITSMRWGRAAAISAMVPLAVELWQLFIAKGRTCDVDDIILNFIGIFLGFATVIIYRSIRSKNGKRNNRRNKQGDN